MTLFHAFHQISNLVPHSLLLCGEGSDFDILSQLCISLNIVDRVHFLGYVPEPYKLIQDASVFVLPSLYEGMPNVLLEAICIGVPVISSNCPSGPYEILGSSYPDLLYEPTDISRLSNLILQQLSSPKVVSKDVLSSFTVESVTNQFIYAFSSLL